MNFRIFSWFVPAITLITVSTVIHCESAQGQDKPGYYTDPSTGIVYRQVTRTVERPIVETKIEKKEQTVFRPETVTETKPESQTVFMPETDYAWEPVLHGRWNPFRQPTLSYKHIPRTQWKAQEQVVNRTQTRTNWVAEKRTVDVPQKIVRIQREQKVDYEAVGRVAPPQATPPSNVSEAIASRLRPLAANTTVQPINTGAGFQARTYNLPPAGYGVAGYGVNVVPRIASAASIGRMTSDPPRRSTSQGGMRSTELYPSVPTGYGQSLPPVRGTGIANMPGWSLWR